MVLNSSYSLRADGDRDESVLPVPGRYGRASSKKCQIYFKK